MQRIPTLVQDLGIARQTNSVYVGTMKFTVEQVEAFTNNFPSDTPDVALLMAQLADAKTAYNVLNEAYAKTLRSAITDEISGLDTEGDQLYMAVKQTAEGAQKMTFDAQRVAAANHYIELLKKYRVDTKENMISEWSKIQQLCEEVDGNATLEFSAEKLGITAAIARLATIADTIRTKISQRSGELPEAQQMKKARTAMDPQYKALIQILNASAIIYGQSGSFDDIIRTLNDNINYVKIHAMTGAGTGIGNTGGSTSGNTDNGGSTGDNGTDNGGNGTDNGGDEPIPGSGGSDNSGGGDDEPGGDDH